MPTGKARDSKLSRQLSELRYRLMEAEDTLSAIRNGAVDALVVSTPRGEQLFTLKGADQTYRALVEGMNEGALTIRRGIISFCNNRFAEMSRAPMERVFGASVNDYVIAPGLPALLKRLEKGTLSAGVLEGHLRAADGHSIPVRVSASRFESEGVGIVSLVLTDTTAQIEAHRASKEISRKIINALERERQRVARDLHDSVNQLLATAKYRLGSLASQQSNPGDAKSLEMIGNVIERALAEVRAISRNLRPSELDDLGLIAALRSLIHEFRQRSGISARFNHDRLDSSLPIPKEVELTIYRIAQESLNNVEKHSRARRVTLSLKGSLNTDLLFTVQDDGKGFLRESERITGWGLQNITQRAALFKGYVEIQSVPGKGTRISVHIPIASEPPAQSIQSNGSQS